MCRHEKWIHRCLKVCKKSDHLYFKHAALLVQSGRIVSVGVNKYRKGGIETSCYDSHCHFHAEFDCLHKLDREQIEGGELYVTGWLSRSGGLLHSKPCKYCQNYLKRFRLKAIYYSTPDDIFGKLIL